MTLSQFLAGKFAETSDAISLAALARQCGAIVLQRCEFQLEKFVGTALHVDTNSFDIAVLFSRNASTFTITSTNMIAAETVVICNGKNKNRRLVARSPARMIKNKHIKSDHLV